MKEARLQKNLSIDDVAKDTKIRPAFLMAIENSEYHKLPSPSYTQGFVRNYAVYLGLSERETMMLLRREFDQEKEVKVLPKGFVNEKPITATRIKISQAVLGIGIILFLVGAFLLYQYRYAFLDPTLKVSTPEENAVVTQEVLLKGETDPNVSLYINDEPVTVTNEGSFSKTVTAFPGKAVITIKAENSFGRATIIERTVQVQPGS